MGQNNQVVGKPSLFAPQPMTHAFIQSILQPRFNGCVACNTTLPPPFEHIDPVGTLSVGQSVSGKGVETSGRSPVVLFLGAKHSGDRPYLRSGFDNRRSRRQPMRAPMNPCVSCPLRASTRLCVPWTRADEVLPFQECVTGFSFSWDPLRIKPRLKSVPLSSHIWRIVHSSVCPSPVSTLRCTLFAPVSIFSMVAVYD